MEISERIIPKNQHLINCEVRELEGLLYFRTMENIDKNGSFDESDRVHLCLCNVL